MTSRAALWVEMVGEPRMNTEAAVRNQLVEELISESRAPWAIIEEFWIPISHERADLVFMQNGLQAFEIKTERDSLRRLSRQVKAYTRIFDTCTVVVAARHVDQACCIIPEWWGIWEIPQDSSLSFGKIRKSMRNELVEPEMLVRLLWRDEVKVAITNLGHPPSPNMGRSLMWEKLVEHASIEELKSIVESFVQRRDPGRARIMTRRFSRAAAELR